jgi:hypothetical protein
MCALRDSDGLSGKAVIGQLLKAEFDETQDPRMLANVYSKNGISVREYGELRDSPCNTTVLG